MGCPSSCEIDDNLTFSVCTHDPDTGVLTDADTVPSYRVYEDETGTAILNGNMAKLDDANTTGFYTETLAVAAANGFEDGKTYTVYIEATVDSDTGGICYSFKSYNTVATIDSILSLLDDARTEPGDTAPPVNPDMATKVDYLYKFMRNKIETTSSRIHVYDDSGTNKDQSSTISDDGSTFTRGVFGAGDA